ncbi:DUF502 domain-containing protein [Pseudothauera lacus]|uniref:DUF502 domain-containing protein n=1 Tax=Pseudothauera lacus TaxID=2136175 RepID=A0A2T4IEZ1_9RHOO|nr:DUF502 domain-containing protein [Pseudothauera lacus]PTD96331.1 hypothetical protein C8261_10485 [Pseudothauera lacus]
MMKSIGRVFVTGLLTVIPVLATVFLIVWFVEAAEGLVGAQVRQLIPDIYYVAGMGIAVVCLMIFLVGLLMRAWLFRELTARAERLLLAIPLVRSIYAAVRDLLGLIVERDEEARMQVVAVELPGTGMRLIGFVTRSDFSDLPRGVGHEGEVAVYLPMSYMVGGYTVFVPREAVTTLAWSREEAMKFILIAGIRAMRPAPGGRT